MSGPISRNPTFQIKTILSLMHKLQSTEQTTSVSRQKGEFKKLFDYLLPKHHIACASTTVAQMQFKLRFPFRAKVFENVGSRGVRRAKTFPISGVVAQGVYKLVIKGQLRSTDAAAKHVCFEFVLLGERQVV